MTTTASSLRDLLSGPERSVVDAILETTPSIAVIADADRTILRVSRYGCELSGWDPREVEGLTIAEYLSATKPADSNGRLLADDQVPLVRALKGEHLAGLEGSFLHRSGERIPIVANAAPFVGAHGEVLGAITSVTDLRTFKALEHELRTLYGELAHRVKNHLQIMSTLVGLEGRNAHGALEGMVARLSSRMHSLSAIYERMNQADVGGHVVARAFVDEIVQPYRTETIDVKVSVPERLTLSHRQAAPLGMLINEAVCNGHKHAFPDGRHGMIDVALRRKAPNQLELEIADNGIGYKIDAPTKAPHGLNLMQLQAEQLNGEIRFSHRRGGGARVVAVIPHEFLVSEAAAREPALGR